MANVTGWNELINGSMIQASNVLFTSYYGDWFITLLFIGFKILLYFASDGDPYLMVVSSLIFLSLFYSMINSTIIMSVVAIVVIELGMVLYSILFKK